MTTDPRSTCIIGVAQGIVRPDDGPSPEPLDLWADVVTRAFADTGADGVGARVDGLQVVFCQSWDYDDPTGRLAARLGIAPRLRRYSGIGGTTPQLLVDQAAARLAAGQTSVEVVCMGEAIATVKRSYLAGGPPAWSYPPPVKVRFPFEAPAPAGEKAHKIRDAWLTFALRDVARRAAAGVDPARYQADLAVMMSRLTEVAATNPYAWFPFEQDAAQVGEVRADNRYVAEPYTKRMCSMLDVDLSAAVVVTTHEVADELGVPADRRVYLHASAYGEDPLAIAAHPDLARSEALPLVTGRAFGDAGVGIDDVAHLDLYSCFPASLGFAKDALGLADDDPRPLTVTGGLPYAGGAGSGYLVNALAAMTTTLRDDAGSTGLVTGIGMHLTKHIAAVYSTRPPASGTRTADLGAVCEAPVQIVDQHEGEATVAATAVVHGRDGEPAWAPVIVDVAPGVRTYAISTDPSWLLRAGTDEVVGTTVGVLTDPRGFNLVHPID
ncbi:acetyl-CoA synthetase [Aquihabitans sp. McL0605]|uniref:acetyl-CoA synthetase n=1 Tax=Aquihabitans sp. McL0605 TaxID=3415671 RepID=UPI003CFB1363